MFEIQGIGSHPKGRIRNGIDLGDGVFCMSEVLPSPSSVCHFDMRIACLPTAKFLRRPLQLAMTERSLVMSCLRGQWVRQVLMRGIIWRMMFSVAEVSSSEGAVSKRLMY